MLHSRFAAAAAALALTVFACSDDEAPATGPGPAFGGVQYVVPDNTGKLVVAWQPVPDAVDYRVYVSKIQGRQLKTTPAARSNGSSVVLTPDTPGARYYVTVRAANVAGLEDGNAEERSAVAAPDTAPPTFAGLKAAEASGNAGVRLTWDPATDDTCPPQAIVYDVYAGRSPTTMVKAATTLPGDREISFAQIGNPGEQFSFAVRARDVAGNTSAELPPISSAIGPDATLPIFEGCDTVTPQGARAASVTWKPGSDNTTPASALSYEVYVSKTPGGHDLNAPSAKVVGDTAALLTNLDPASTYFVLCKVRDAANNLDANRNEKELATSTDVVPPAFAGVTGADFDGAARKVKLEWAPATDDQTAPSAIVYDVFESRASGKFDFTTPRASSAPGATSVELTNLASRSTLYWVVRARDAAGNRDTNLAEQSGTTAVSYALDVQSIFDLSCAVVGCHVSGPNAGGLNLAPKFSYGALVGVDSTLKRGVKKRVDTTPGGDGKPSLANSFLWEKIDAPDVGDIMPAPGTGNSLVEEKNIIREWIENGALAN